MKKTFTLLMALALVTSLMAVPVNPLHRAQGLKIQKKQNTEQRVSSRHIRKATAPVTFSGSDFTGGTADTGSAMTIKKGGVTITTDKGYGTGKQLRVYKDGTLTITATEKMTKIAFENDANAKLVLQDQTPNATTWSVSATKQIRLNEITVSFEGSAPVALDTLTVAEALAETKKLAAGASSNKKYVIEGYVSSVAYEYKDGKETFYMTDTKGDRTGELQAYKCSLSEAANLDNKVSVTGKLMNYVKDAVSTYEITGGVGTILEGGGGGGQKGDTIYLNTMVYADAYLSSGYWDFDLYVDYDENSYELTYPEFYFSCDDETESETAICGEWAMYYAGVWNSEKDSMEMTSGSMKVTVNADKSYNFYGEFEGENGKVYIVDCKNVDVYAMDYDNDYEEIELDEQGGGGGTGEEIYYIDFTAGQDDWTIDDVDRPTDLTFVWKQNSTYGMKASAYNKSAYAAESWLISPLIDLGTATEPTLIVNQALNQGANTNLKVKISTDGGDAWKDLSIDLPEGTSWDFEEDEVSLSAYAGQQVMIAFVYVSTTTVCPAWEIKEVTITGEGGGQGGDTIQISNLDGLEIDYYPSYSEEGAYSYTFLLYNSEDENYLPMLALDLYTSKEKAYAGTYTMKEGNLTEYSYYLYGEGDDDYAEFTDGEVTIKDKGNGKYNIKGWFTDGQNVYTFDATADGEYINVDYAYEPEKATTLNLNVTDGEMDNSYAEDYGIIDIYLTTADGDLVLEYILSATDDVTTIADGTYPIEATEYDEEGEAVAKNYGYFDAGSYFSYFGTPVGSYYMDEEANYYLVGGSVTIQTVDAGKKVTLAGTTYYGSTINAEYTILPSALSEVVATSKISGKFFYNGKLYIQTNGVIYNAQGQVVK